MGTSVADPGFVILDPNFFHLGSRFKKVLDPGSGSASMNVIIFNPKIVFLALENMIPDLDFYHPGSRSMGQKGTGSRIQIRNTVGNLRQVRTSLY